VQIDRFFSYDVVCMLKPVEAYLLMVFRVIRHVVSKKRISVNIEVSGSGYVLKYGTEVFPDWRA